MNKFYLFRGVKMIEMPNGLIARENTSDEGTWHDVFDEDKAYHRYPLKMKWATAPKRIVDLGAYAGYTTYDFAQLHLGAFILAVEPDPSSYTMLETNTEGIDAWRISYECAAIASWTGYGKLEGEHYNAKKIFPGAIDKVFTLDDLLARHKNFKSPIALDYIKFDIEGAEREVLRGATTAEWPSRTRCVQVEVHDEYYVSECIADLQNLGFQAKQSDSHNYAVIGWKKI